MPNKWITHVMQYHKDHPNISYKEAMKDATPSYKKDQKGKGGCMSRSAEVAPDTPPRQMDRKRRESIYESGLSTNTNIPTTAAPAPVQSHNARVKMLLTKSGLM